MGAIKDIVDLSTQLANSVQDRKFSFDLFKIIELISIVQVDQAQLTESNVQLMSDKAEMQKIITSLETDILKLKQQIFEIKKAPQEVSPQINEVTSSILECFFKNQSNLSVNDIALQLNIEPSDVSYHFDLLRENDYIQQATSERIVPRTIRARGGNAADTPATFRITPNGRKYVVEVIQST